MLRRLREERANGGCIYLAKLRGPKSILSSHSCARPLSPKALLSASPGYSATPFPYPSPSSVPPSLLQQADIGQTADAPPPLTADVATPLASAQPPSPSPCLAQAFLPYLLCSPLSLPTDGATAPSAIAVAPPRSPPSSTTTADHQALSVDMNNFTCNHHLFHLLPSAA